MYLTGGLVGNSSRMTISSPFSPTLAAQTGDYPSHGASNFVDGSGPIFSMYMEMATEEDKKMVEGWKADADGILIFVRLYLPMPLYGLLHRVIFHRPVYSLPLLRH